MKALGRSIAAVPRFIRENSATLFCIAAFIAVAAPFFWNIHLYASWGDGHIAESSIYSIDKVRFFSDFRHNLSVFNGGQYSVFVLNYFVLYALWSTLGTVFSDITAYLTLTIGFYLLAYVFIVRLFLYLIERKGVSRGSRDLVTAAFIALLFLSSLSMFNYIKSNILFALPYLVLPPLLYYAARYLDGRSPWNLFPYVVISLVLTDFNFAHALIIVGFVNVFAAVLAWDARYRAGHAVRRILVLNVCVLPALCVLFGIVLANALYTSGLGSFAAIVAENMYSDNARFLNIFAQLTDWGIFGSWNGELYYGYSPFYLNPAIWFFGALPYVWLGYAALVAKPESRYRQLAIAMLVVAVFVFAVMLGNNNPAYRFLYTHVVAFQIFRNITKLAPLLLLSILMAGFLLVRDRLRERPVYLVTLALLAAALIYNVPFWSYSSYIFRDRAMRDVPEYWTQAAAFMNERATTQSKILALPAIYINDIYNWDGKPAWVQGSLMDVLFRMPSYRLSECCIGAPQFQADAKNLFVPSRSSIRKLDIDYRGLSAFVRKYHLDYVIVTGDLRSEYQRSADISRWLSATGYTRVAAFGPLRIYENAALTAPIFRGPVQQKRQVNNLDYDIVFHGLKGKTAFEFARPFSAGWRLYWRHEGANSAIWSEFADVLQKRQIPAIHSPWNDGSNTWTVDVAQIIRNAPPGAYQHNADGSIDLRAKLLFAPQAYVYIIIFAGLAGFFGVILFIALAVRKLGDPVNRSAVAGIVAAGLVIISAVAAYHPKPSDPGWFTAAQADHALTNIAASAAEADTIYEPSTCTDGATSCVRFYAHDSSGGQHYWGWDYDPHKQVLRSCASYSDLSAACAQWAPDAVHGIASFDVATLPDSPAHGNAVLLQATAGNTKIQKLIHAGRRGFTAPAPDSALPPFAKNVEVTDPKIEFINAHAAPRVTTATLQNFGPFLRYIAQPWAVSPCGNVATASLVTSKRTTDSTSVAVRPANPGRCTFEVSAAPAQNVASPATVTVNVMGPLSWSQGDAQSNDMVFPSVISEPHTLSVHKPFSSEPLDVRFGESCSAVVSLGAGDTSIGEGETGASRAIVLKPLKAGRCVAVVRDQYSADSPIRVGTVVMGALSFSAAKDTKAAALRFSGTDDAVKTLDLYKQYDSSPIRPVLGVNGCSAVAAFEFDRGFAPPDVGVRPAMTRVLVRPANIGRCTVTFGDQYGNDERGITATISVSPAIVFASSTASAKKLQVFQEQRPVSASLKDGGCANVLESTAAPGGTVLRPMHSGVCGARLSIENSGEDVLKARVMGDLTVAQSPRGDVLALRFAGKKDPAQTIEFEKTWDNEALVPTLIRNGCAAMVGFYLQPAHVPASPSSSPASTNVLVRPIKPGSCTAVFGDQYGDQDRKVTMSIRIGTQ